MSVRDDDIASAAEDISRLLLSDRTIYLHFLNLFARSYRQQSLPDYDTAIREFVKRFVETLIETVLRDSVDVDSAYLADIRTFFLQPQDRYSLEYLSRLWHVPRAHIADICDVQERDAECQITWQAAAALAVVFNIFRPFDVERALGREFDLLRSDAWRTVPVLVRLPKFVLSAAHDLAPPRSENLPARVERLILDLLAVEYHPHDLIT